MITGAVKTLHNQTPIESLKKYSFVSCKYDSFWWIGIIEEIDIGQKDVKVKFMHPHGPSMKFSWPSHDDICWIPFENILTEISPPTTRSGRIYEITTDDYNEIVNL